MAGPGGAGAPMGGAPQDTELSQEDVQQAFLAGDALRQQLAAIEEQRAYLSELLQDTERSRTALEALKDLPEGEELLLPIGAGNFVHARVTDAGKVLTSLGAGVHLEAPIPTALERLDERLDSLKKARERLARESDHVQSELARVNLILQQVQGV